MMLTLWVLRISVLGYCIELIVGSVCVGGVLKISQITNINFCKLSNAKK